MLMTTRSLWVSVSYPNGKSAAFAPTDVTPLDAELLSTLDHEQPLTVDMKMAADGTEIDGELREGEATIEISLTFDHAATVFSLVPGGWTPMPFTMPPNFLVDQNIVIRLRRIREGKVVANAEAMHFWLQLLEGRTTLLNPLPYAWEGQSRRKPTRQEFESSYEAGAHEIAQALPSCSVVQLNQVALDAAYSQLEAFDRRGERETRFLEEVCPLLLNRPAAPALWRTAQEVLALADKHGIQRGALPSLAALSCVFEDEHGAIKSIGKRILKPTARYSEGDAYNALSDIRHMELAAAGQALLPERPFSLCTCDRGLAMFWSALKLRVRAQADDCLETSFILSRSMFQRLQAEQIEQLRAALAG
jgi:hypothetical protein